MTVHMLRVFIGRGPMALSDLETRIDDRVEWTAKDVTIQGGVPEVSP